jgi:hypothetical protein
MGVLLVADDEHVRLQQARCDMRVQIEGDADRRTGGNKRAHAFDDVALGVLLVLERHRAMQGEQHPVHRQRRLQPRQRVAERFLEHRALDRPARAGIGIEQRHRCRARRVQHRERAGISTRAAPKPVSSSSPRRT